MYGVTMSDVVDKSGLAQKKVDKEKKNKQQFNDELEIILKILRAMSPSKKNA